MSQKNNHPMNTGLNGASYKTKDGMWMELTHPVNISPDCILCPDEVKDYCVCHNATRELRFEWCSCKAKPEYYGDR